MGTAFSSDDFELFERPPQSYELDPRLVGWILSDPANPLNQVARLIPDGSDVLDVGAGNGILAHVLAQVKSQVNVDGIEPSEEAAAAARTSYRRFYNDTAEACVSEVGTACYDYLVLADVIEHVANPVLFLSSLRPLLKNGGKIILSTPNIAFASVRVALLNGHFDYVDSGIIERTHLRFFTYSTLLKLVSAVGMHAELVCFLVRDPLTAEIPITQYKIGLADLMRLSRDQCSTVYQFLIVLDQSPTNTRIERYGSGGDRLVLRYFVKRITDSMRRNK